MGFVLAFIHQNVKQDTDYLEAAMKENELNKQFKKLNLSDNQQNVITQWIDAIQVQEFACTAVVFYMAYNSVFLY